MLLYLCHLLTPSSSSLLLTLSSKDLDLTKACMDNKHPLIPETLDCSEKFYATSISLLISIEQLLTMIDPNYSSKPGSFKKFPGLESGSLMAKSSSHWDINESPDLGRYWAGFMGYYIGWCSAIQDTNQYYQAGSSIPFIFEGLSISGRDHLNH